MNLASVYVVIVTYNPKEWLEKCFSSLNDSEIKIQTIVIDNGSNDGSQYIIKKQYPEVEFYQGKKNYGFGLANNIGIKIAYDRDADFVFLLNQDAWIEPDTIRLLVDKMKQEDGYGILSPMHLNGKGDALDLSFSDYISPINSPKLFSDIYLNKNLDKIYESMFVNAAAWLMNRKCIEKIGGFSPSFFHYGEDDNYVKRMHFYHLKLGVYPLAKVYHDREQRLINKYYSDYSIVVERSFISFYSDPLIDVSFVKGQIELLKYMISSILNFRFEDAWKILKKWISLFSKFNFLKATRKMSMKVEEQCFLPSSIDQYFD